MATAKRTAVLGAGALGLTLAYRLAQAGESVTVLEREPSAGGLAAGFEVARTASGEPILLEKFYHHLFRADHAAIALIEELGLGPKLLWPKPVSAILRDNKIYNVGPLDLLRLEALPPVDRIRFAAVGLYLKLEKGYQRLEGHTASDWVRTWMGENAYRVFAEPLLRQKFGEYAEQIAMPWFWSRIHLRSSALGYLKDGFQQLYDTLSQRIVELGGSVGYGETVMTIATSGDGTLSITSTAGIAQYDRVISTLPAAVTFALTPEMPAAFRERYAPGPALSAHCLILALDRPLTDRYWIAINDPGFPFLAVVEHTNYMSAADYAGKHLVYVGNYLPPGHPLLTQEPEEVLARFLPFLQRINPELKRSWITELHSFTAPFAQPLVTIDYRERIGPHLTPVPNLYMANMFQIYPQDRGQNYSIAMAERLARRLVRHGEVERKVIV